ncbi:hypothetical protein VNO77_34423 [Canavalia gladiata]|uniref:Uncharacterized protein n=1 Tax=Canavalia gladiata TaxID=3824 RepID=A0AAN9PZ85_CANGL
MLMNILMIFDMQPSCTWKEHLIDNIHLRLNFIMLRLKGPKNNYLEIFIHYQIAGTGVKENKEEIYLWARQKKEKEEKRAFGRDAEGEPLAFDSGSCNWRGGNKRVRAGSSRGKASFIGGGGQARRKGSFSEGSGQARRNGEEACCRSLGSSRKLQEHGPSCDHIENMDRIMQGCKDSDRMPSSQAFNLDTRMHLIGWVLEQTTQRPKPSPSHTLAFHDGITCCELAERVPLGIKEVFVRREVILIYGCLTCKMDKCANQIIPHERESHFGEGSRNLYKPQAANHKAWRKPLHVPPRHTFAFPTLRPNDWKLEATLLVHGVVTNTDL